MPSRCHKQLNFKTGKGLEEMRRAWMISSIVVFVLLAIVVAISKLNGH